MHALFLSLSLDRTEKKRHRDKEEEFQSVFVNTNEGGGVFFEVRFFERKRLSEKEKKTRATRAERRQKNTLETSSRRLLLARESREEEEEEEEEEDSHRLSSLTFTRSLLKTYTHTHISSSSWESKDCRNS